MDKVFCFECKSAVDNNFTLPLNTFFEKRSKEAFAVNGFNNWKKSLERFKIHEGNYYKTQGYYLAIDILYMYMCCVFYRYSIIVICA